MKNREEKSEETERDSEGKRDRERKISYLLSWCQYLNLGVQFVQGELTDIKKRTEGHSHTSESIKAFDGILN